MMPYVQGGVSVTRCHHHTDSYDGTESIRRSSLLPEKTCPRGGWCARTKRWATISSQRTGRELVGVMICGSARGQNQGGSRGMCCFGRAGHWIADRRRIRHTYTCIFGRCFSEDKTWWGLFSAKKNIMTKKEH